MVHTGTCGALVSDDAIEVVVSRPAPEPAAVCAAAALLSDAERLRASRFSFPRDRRRYVLNRAALRRLLGERLGVAPAAVELVYGGRGKPALAPRLRASGLRFNLSHCEDVAVYAFSTDGEIGVDVEAVREMSDADDVAARFFSRREHAAYRALDPRDRPLGFFQCWTRKEAFVKALGDGICHPLDRFAVSLAPGEPARFLHIDPTPGDSRRWRVESFVPAAGFVAAVVTEDRP